MGRALDFQKLLSRSPLPPSLSSHSGAENPQAIHDQSFIFIPDQSTFSNYVSYSLLGPLPSCLSIFDIRALCCMRGSKKKKELASSNCDI
jgi:hypothetical protein